MNFNKYHVSRNLFDKDNTTIYSAYFDATGSWLLSSDSKSVKMPCQPNTQYTLSVPNSLAVFRIYVSDNASIEPSSTSPPRATEIIRGTDISQYTFTTSSTAQIILFQGSNGAVTEWFNGLMFNTGSEALPFEPHGNTWTDSHYIMGTSTDTLTTLPAVLYPNAATATVGLKGNTSQSGTPSPDNPIMPQGTGERTGNLCNESTIQNGYYGTGTGFPYSANDNYRCFSMILSAGTYTILAQSDSLTIRLLRVSSDSLGQNAINADNTAYTFTLSATETIYVSMRNSTTTNDFTGLTIMLNTGSTAKPYEPHGIKIPISSANTTTNVYLGEVQTTRKIRKLVLTGKENWKYSTSSQAHWIENVPNDYDNTLISRITTVCTHYNCIQNNTGFSGMVNGDLRLYAKEASPIAHELYIKDETYTSAADFKAYLAAQYAAGTPVCVWYVLAESTTGIVNEPLRKIGKYADTVSGITIPTITGKDTFDVLTTLKPSEVDLTYTGWHDASVGEWDGSDWQ